MQWERVLQIRNHYNLEATKTYSIRYKKFLNNVCLRFPIKKVISTANRHRLSRNKECVVLHSCNIHVSKWEFKENKKKKDRNKNKKELGVKKGMGRGQVISPRIFSRAQAIWRSSGICLKNAKVFWHQSESRTAATVWNWSSKTLSPGTSSPRSLLFFAPFFFPPV